MKRWKLSYEDFRNRGKWDDYVQAIEDMVARTSTAQNPWHVIPANDKRYARLECLRTINRVLSDNVDLSPRPLDAQVIKEAIDALGIDLRDLVNHDH
jgi:hypothetical protein